jgi:hypothetical protein
MFVFQGRIQQEVLSIVQLVQLVNIVRPQQILPKYLALLDLFQSVEQMFALHAPLDGNVQMLMGLAMQGVCL